jgi:dTDP-4-amino-4,6-dideoxygalactose transaminase
LPFATAVHYPRSSTQEPLYAPYTRAPCPQAEAWAQTCVTIPCFAEMTDAEIDTVADALAKLD